MQIFFPGGSSPVSKLFPQFSQTRVLRTDLHLVLCLSTVLRKRSPVRLRNACFFLSDRAQQKRVFDTVKVANDTRGRSVPFPVLLPIPGSNRSSVIMTAKPFESGVQQAEDKTLLSQGSGTEVPG